MSRVKTFRGISDNELVINERLVKRVMDGSMRVYAQKSERLMVVEEVKRETESEGD